MEKYLKRLYFIIFAMFLSLSFSSPAQAWLVNFMPQQEGEVNVLGGSPLGGGSYLTFDPLLGSVSSNLMTGTYANRSRLFIDDTSTANVYGPVSFGTTDGGTSGPLGEYWFRPVAVKHILNDQNYPEQGNLEIGTYTFTFAKKVDYFDIYYFDTESTGTTGVTAINGVSLSAVNWVPAGADGNIYQQHFYDVSSFALKLGNFNSSTGDGVNFQISGMVNSVPEFPPFAMPFLASVLGFGLWVRTRFVR